MRRLIGPNRPNKLAQFEELGFDWHTLDDGRPYWDESHFYELTSDEVDELEGATETLLDMVHLAVGKVIDGARLPLYGYEPRTIELIEKSWYNSSTEPSFYGRFDLAYGSPRGTGSPKLLEFNGDTPTSLYEAAVVQWHWALDAFGEGEFDQFNSIHEKLRDALVKLGQFQRAKVHVGPYRPAKLYTTSVVPNAEDEGQLMYLRSVCEEAGLPSDFINVSDIGWREGGNEAGFVDLNDEPMRLLFKLLPWEWLISDPFGQNLIEEALNDKITVLEPAWKMVCSNKRFLVDLWEIFPEHDLLLPASMNPNDVKPFGPMVAKPLFGREGANVTITDASSTLEVSAGTYETDERVYQTYEPLFEDGGRHAVIGSWVIDSKSAGIGVRESSSLITGNTSSFVPHIFR